MTMTAMLNPTAVVRAKSAFLTQRIVDERVVPAGVYRSWERCISSELRQDDPIEFLAVARSNLMQLRDSNSQLLDASTPQLERLGNAVGGAGYVVLLTDTHGHALKVVGALDRRDGMMWHAHREGVNLSEPVIGTSAMACAMAERKAMNVFCDEHFFEINNVFQCSAAPIIDSFGSVVGSVNVARTRSLPNPGMLTFVKQCAREIEEELLRRRPSFLSIRLTWQPSKNYSGESLVLAFGSDGEIIAVNEMARVFLRCSAPVGLIRFEDLFDLGFGEFVRSIRNADGPVVLRFHEGTVMHATAISVGERPSAMREPRIGSGTDMPGIHGIDSQLEFGDRSINTQIATAIKTVKAGLPALILGETGTGKEVVANAIHGALVGGRGKMIAVNCAAIPENLIEAELFGHVEGAFTGARRGGSPGKIELADGGTLFLDEIGDMPLCLQARLLRVLETKSVCRLGSGTMRHVSFVLVCATHQNIDLAVKEGRFRRDLYYRINGAVIELAPVRKRPGVRELMRTLLTEISDGTRSMSKSAEDLLCRQMWPGNVRELRHALTFAHAMAPQDEPLQPGDFRLEIQAPPESIGEMPDNRSGILGDLEKEAVRNALRSADGHVGRAAKILGISRATLYRWLKRG
ncbi:MAG: sigma-54-dependent Fis family transcriptional regulator [Rhodocyclales bacterium]|nr:sigma-54-dependent Fis family transcriptional regulator [Rhodocyclales bacterium]